MSKHPFCIQSNAMDCDPICLRISPTHHEKLVDSQQLPQLMHFTEESNSVNQKEINPVENAIPNNEYF